MPAGEGGPSTLDPRCRARRRRRDGDLEHETSEGFMSHFRNALLGLAALGALAAPALAQSHMTAAPGTSPTTFDGVMLYYPDTGRMVMGHVDKAAMEMAMKHAKPLNGPVMIVTSGGKAYIVENTTEKMADGSRMIDFFDKRTYGNF
jgi:hypothetical protein